MGTTEITANIVNLARCSVLDSTGSKIIFIGNGSPDYINIFKESLGIQKAVILTDPTLESYKAAGFHHGFVAWARPKSVLNYAKLSQQGYRQGEASKESGSHWQMGGVLAVLPAGKIVYQFISVALGDLPPDSDVEVMTRS